jgi:biotin carboxyl carrier protein
MSRLTVTIDGQPFEIELVLTPECAHYCTAEVNGEVVTISVPESGAKPTNVEWMIIGERPYELTFADNLSWLRAFSGIHTVDIQDRDARVTRPRSGDGRVKAPIPGLVSRVLVAPGERVQADQPIIVLEAMKMENEIRAPFEGVVRSVAVAPGQTVTRNAILAEIA